MIELRDLEVEAGGFTVGPVDLRAGDGRYVVLLGPSGAGKSLVLEAVAGVRRATAGQVRLAGTDVTALSPERRRVGLVFQDGLLFPHLTVFENVAFELRVRREPKAEIKSRVVEALKLVRLDHLANRNPGQLSGGQRQRVALARAVVGRPAVVLLDEPLGALDQQLRKEMQIELKTLQREVGITFIYVTHDQEEALTMSDRIAVMSEGRVLQVGTPVEIYEHPATRFVAGFIGSCNVLDASLSDRGVEVAEFGIVPGVAPSGLTPVTAVTVAVRPERISVSPVAVPQALQGRSSEIIYTGDEWRFGVHLGSTHLVAAVPAASLTPELAALSPNDDIWVSWAADDARILTS